MLSTSAKFGLRMALREWRKGELKLLLISLIIAVTSLVTIGMFIERIGFAMDRQSAEFLGADIALSSNRPIDKQWYDLAKENQLNISEEIYFSSVAFANEQLKLSAIRVADTSFPLRGKLVIGHSQIEPGKAQRGVPNSGEVWIAHELLQSLKLKLGQTLQLGFSTFTVTGIIQDEPGKGQEVFGIQPRLMMNRVDLDATKLVQPGSRINYRLALAGKHENIQSFEQAFIDKKPKGMRILGGKESSEALGNAIGRAEQYLGFANVITILLTAIAIGMASLSYVRKQINTSALFRCMGISQSELWQLYSTKFLVLGSASIFIGVVFGVGLHWVLIEAMQDLLPEATPAATSKPLIVAIISGYLILMGVSLPGFMQLKNTPPMQVLQQTNQNKGWSIYIARLITFSVLTLVVYWQVPNLTLVAGLLVGLVLVSLILGGMTWLLLWKLQWMTFGQPWIKFSIRNLTRSKLLTAGQAVAVSSVLVMMLTVFLLRTDLLTAWQEQLPDNAPNRFVFNIAKPEVEGIKALMEEHTIEQAVFYPMVRGKLIKRDQQDIKMSLNERQQEENALRRELNLTWSDQLPEGNEVLEGRWLEEDKAESDKPWVSVESGLAKRLDIKIGDVLGFNLAGIEIEAEVTSIRKVEWDSFRPNFYMVFQPGAINEASANYITSFYLNPESKDFLVQLVKSFPAITLIDVDAIMNQVRTVLNQVTIAIEYILIFVLFAGLSVLYAIILSSIDERIKNSAIARTLGASKKLLTKALTFEFALLGLMAGVVSIVATEVIGWLLYTKVFKLDWAPHLWIWASAPSISILIVVTLGLATCLKVVKVPPLKVLRHES
jgi:putative ABC transport system permease protein